MKHFRLSLLLIFLLTCFPVLMQSQTVSKPWALGFGLAGRDFEALPDGSVDGAEILPVFHLQLERYLGRAFNLGLQSGFSPAKNNSGQIYEDLNDFDLLLKWKIANGGQGGDGVFVLPILAAGLGGGYSGSENPFNFHIPAGLGLRFQVAPAVALDFMSLYKYSMGDLGNYVSLQGAVNIGFGKGKKQEPIAVPMSDLDSDGDGIPDSRDACPKQSGPMELGGCPDRDSDGVADKDDLCPEVAGLLSLQGCPQEVLDTDGDGVPDELDACPTVAGLSNFSGCPDTDGDGVIDKDDLCPDVVGLVQFQGCPDADGDGIPDKDDDCPAVAGLITLRGCPDSDGDGVKDSEDRCPEVAGIIELKGCPEVSDEVITRLATVTKSVQFETGSATLKASSKPILDQIVQIMDEYPAYSLKISGYTDSSGDDAKNLSLSKARANTCLRYLKEKGLDESRMEANGYGEANPIADNGTNFGRSKNRRVEFELFVK